MLFNRSFTLILLLGLTLIGCTQYKNQKEVTPNISVSTDLAALKSQQLGQAILKYTQEEVLPRYAFAMTDLNNDAIDDAIVLLQGQNRCGSGGCTLLVLQGLADNKYQVVSTATVVDTPIYALSYRTHGWRDLMVYSKGTGSVRLQFDGDKYPSNPSLLPAETRKFAPDSFELLLE